MKVALAYSGGLDTSVAARWLREEMGVDVVAVTVDVGQAIDRAGLHARAEAAGAEVVIVDAREEFVTRYCWPALQANALYEGKYPLVSALARPLIAAKVVEVARAVGAGSVAHGCTGKGNDQVRFETTFAALAPDLPVLAPVRQGAMSRDEARARAAAWGIPIAADAKVYSVDENLWGRTVECGPLEDPWVEPPAGAFVLTEDPSGAPDRPEDVVVSFHEGVPVALNGEPLPAVELVERVGKQAGRHGFGRVDMVENRLVGIKSRELYEVPAALALIAAHRDLEDLTLERDVAHEKSALERRWAELAYNGQWDGPLHASLRAFVASTQATVSGEVRIRLFKGSCTVAGRRSPFALYDFSLATYEAAEDRFDHADAEGFVKLWSLPIRTWAARQGAAMRPGGSPPSEDGASPPFAAVAPVPPGPAGRGPQPADERSSPNGGDPPRRKAVSPPDKPLWGGRFDGGPSEAMLAFTRSLRFDLRLAPYDIRATAAHVRGLARAGLVTADDSARIQEALREIGAEIARGAFAWSEVDEDIHSAIERALTERLGATGSRIHAGRSRNDLVVTDLRMWAMDAADGLAQSAASLAEELAQQAKTNADAVMPGYTHLQRAQPILLAHHLLAHAFPLIRDAHRLLRAGEAAGVSSLGAGALAGSTLPVEPATLARDLGFASAFHNSIDAVSDRDFALELVSACTIAAVHISRLAEDLVLWASEEFGFARPADSEATGSSMMPQKRNPDVAELARGKAGRVLGDLVTVATVMKGLPLAYDRDLQEDKEALFDAVDTLSAALAAMTALVQGLTFDHARMREAAGGALLATDVAEHLVSKGMPFRQAHELVGHMVADLEREGRTFEQVSSAEWVQRSPMLSDVSGILSPERSVAARATPGGTSSPSVEAQLETLARLIDGIRVRGDARQADEAAAMAP
ncbi:MAG TPA: argininosuccinate lyase [Actinomycetota bacterium]